MITNQRQMMNEVIGARVHDRRRRAGLTQAELGEAVDLSTMAEREHPFVLGIELADELPEGWQPQSRRTTRGRARAQRSSSRLGTLCRRCSPTQSSRRSCREGRGAVPVEHAKA